MVTVADIHTCFQSGMARLLNRTTTEELPLLPGSAVALLAWALVDRPAHQVLVVTDGPHTLDQCHQDLRTLAPHSDRKTSTASRLLYFPALESLPGETADLDREIEGSRMDVLLALGRKPEGARPQVIVTCIQALMQPVPSPATLSEQALSLHIDTEVEMSDIVAHLHQHGYSIESEVQQKGQAAVKGGLLDVWPATEIWPLRLEFVGSWLESIRTFDPLTQRSVARPVSCLLAPAQAGNEPEQRGSLMDYLDQAAAIVLTDRDGIRDHAELYEARVQKAGGQGHLHTYGDCCRRQQTLGRRIALQTVADALALPIDIAASESVFDTSPLTGDPDVLDQQRLDRLKAHRATMDTKHKITIFFETAGAVSHFKKTHASKLRGVRCMEGSVSGGFISRELGLSLLTEADFYGQRKLRGQRYNPMADVPRPRQDAGDRISDLAALEIGDLVVHIEHGLGRFLGLNEITFDGQRQEVISIEYADEARLHVPASHAHLLSRYVGVGRDRAVLHRLGSKRWQREKQDAQSAIADMAASLLETQAQRTLLEGFAFPPDTPWQREFEAAFPFQETPDQERVIEEVRQDMQGNQPMDRLLCGDAGYGKTEVAMRAAFKCVTAGKQAAVLVPTTVLAQQHYQTFRDRMAPFPFRIEMLSRFCSAAQRTRTLQDLTTGRIDIVIGTHALVQPNVRFHNLGLVI
ncbi:MAG: DEAD/DEAH box helicase, partial [Verrucomicrobia bacterium]|nr:DEAD/DEAH box helicase [Verrucomicrobiota bacterium]